MKKNKIVALIVLGIILLQIVIPSLADIDWNVVFAEETNTWDISQNGDGSVMATLSDDGTLTISGNGKMKDWRNSSDEAWDSNRKNIKNVIINNGVTSIGNFAFSDCTSLTNITIPNSVTSIGDYAFYGCENLINITIQNSVTSIGNFAFCMCTSLTSINVDSNNEKYMSDNGVLYTKDKKTLIQYPSKKEKTEYIILQGTTSIGNYAFHYCTNLTNITIPNSVTSIGDNAFYGCENLINITIPNSVTSIGNDVFNGCISLTSINVDSNNEKYMSDNGVLYTKDKKILIQYPGKKEGTEYLILQGVESIEDYAFWGCGNLTNIIIPNGVTSIGYSAFYRCTSLTNITIPNSVTSIGDFAFNECTSLTNIAIPDSVTSIGDHAFYKCDSLSVLCKSNSYAEQYAKENNIKYVIDDSVPTIKNVTGNEKWTKDKVILIVNAEDSLSGLATEAYSFDNGQTWQKENTKTYTENIQGVIIKVRDAVGNIAIQEIGTIKIDNQAPTIKNVTGNEKWTKDKVILTVNAEDSLSGLATEAYSFDNGQTWQKENTKTYTENTQGIIIKVRDAVGNVATYKTIDINNILKIEISNYEKITKDNNEYLTKIEANTTIAQLKEKIKTNGTIKVLKGNNEITDTNTLVGTGMQIQIETEKYIAIVKADLNGDGKIGLSDLSNIKFSLIGKKQLSTEAQIAGDINGDGKVSLSDMAKLKMYLVGKANI